MGKKIAGTVKELLLAGIPFDLPADNNFTEMGSDVENELIASTGQHMIKKTKRAETIEGITILADVNDRILLKELSESIEPFSMSYTTADGSVFSATGTIDFENRETEENRATIKLLPVGEWTPFIAS